MVLILLVILIDGTPLVHRAHLTIAYNYAVYSHRHKTNILVQTKNVQFVIFTTYGLKLNGLSSGRGILLRQIM